MGIDLTEKYNEPIESKPLPVDKVYRNAKRRNQHKKRGIWQKISTSILNLIGISVDNQKNSNNHPGENPSGSPLKHRRKTKRQKWWDKFQKNPWRTVFPGKKSKSANSKYHYIYPMTKEERTAMILKKRKQRQENKRLLFHTPDLRKKIGYTYLLSTAYFVLAFLFIYFIYQAVTIMIAYSFDIPVTWNYSRIIFPLDNNSPLYSRSNLILIFAAGPFVSLLLAFGFLKLFFTRNSFFARFKLLYLWGFICGINMFFGAYIAGFLTQTEFIYTSAWLFMSHSYAVEEIIFTSISFAIMLILGRIVTPLFLISSGSITLVKPEFRLYYILSGVILPCFTGMLILFAITLPNYYIPLMIKTITPVLIVMPSLFRYKLLKYNDIHKTGIIQRSYFRWGIIITVVALLFFYRLILNVGLNFL